MKRSLLLIDSGILVAFYNAGNAGDRPVTPEALLLRKATANARQKQVGRSRKVWSRNGDDWVEILRSR